MNKLILSAFVALSLFGVGCAAVPQAMTKPLIRETNVVENVEVIPAETNVVADVVTIIPESYKTNYTTNILVRVNPATASTIETIQEINGAVNPTPTAPIINLILGCLTVGLGVVARFQTKRANSANGLLSTVIAGVEAANSTEVKEKIAEVSRMLKTSKQLDKLVQDKTRS